MEYILTATQCIGTVKTSSITNALRSIFMKAISGKKIIYSLNVRDAQNVSKRILNRSLSNKEIASVAGLVGGYIDWNQALENAIRRHARN